MYKSANFLAKILCSYGSAEILNRDLQSIDYQYHIRGWLKGINLDGSGNPTPNTSQGDLFSYKLEYETAGYWDGNIGRQIWHNGTDSRSYSYNYDILLCLKSTIYVQIGCCLGCNPEA